MYVLDTKEQSVRVKKFSSALENFALNECAPSVLTERAFKEDSK